ncbi:TatD family hydrolase [Solitalea lacus]|uniref:TatD family hydrolase n=1 Tax=Solitalea lacus TaxID=2911172 RepID=UPI001EDC5451|nr:TatD family hydrolase [Solitalea lacus]UKJ05897.1 TatD family hydrolase [Solitalea lacus]
MPDIIRQLPYAVSVGVHPWHVEQKNWDGVFFRLNQCLKLPNVLALGEIGLDRSSKVPFGIQRHYFESQLAFAERFKKPVIIHAVRTYTEFVPYLKETSLPFIFHHFTGNHHELEQLLKYNCWFSLGKSLIYPQQKSLEVCKLVPTEKFFLETDTVNISISTVYERAAEVKNISMIELKENVFHNFAAVFGTSDEIGVTV